MDDQTVRPQRQQQRPPRRRRIGLTIFLTLVGVLVLGGIGGAVWVTNYLDDCRTPHGPQEEIAFSVPQGATGTDVIESLAENQVIECPAVARWDLRKRTQEPTFKAGDYTVTTNSGLEAALVALEGPQEVATVTVTIPEGWTVEQMIPELSKSLKVPPGELSAEVERGRALPPYLPAGKPLEGFLFPKTYEFPRAGLTAADVVDGLVEQFGQEVDRLDWRSAKRLGVTPYEVVVIASMIEREAQVASERPRIAAVIYNRLQRKEPLGIDATSQYIDPDPSDGLTASDLAMDSPYNTRISLGLPPTPIASPGLASIRAALDPMKTDEWLYVLCGGNGKHEFTNDYNEFLALKERCL